MLTPTPFDALFFDWESFQGKGLELLEEITSETPDTVLVVLVEQASVDLVLRGIRSIQRECLIKPLRVEEIIHRLDLAMTFRRTRGENSYLRGEAGIDSASPGSLGASPSIWDVHRMIARVAAGQSAALISGEIGTEKSEVAAAIHFASPRYAGPFIKYACGASTEVILERELFGSMGNATPGDPKPQRGSFEIAEEGTVLLIEGSRLPIDFHARLSGSSSEARSSELGGRPRSEIRLASWLPRLSLRHL